MPAELYDSHGRKIDYVRLSLTDRCNYRCVYCMPEHGRDSVPHAEILSYEEMLRLARILAAMGVGRYKVTGGEPLCRKGAVDFIAALKKLPGVAQVTLTSNGALLAPHVDRLAAIGLDGLNVSLDTLRQDHYGDITRSKIPLDEVLPAMTRARQQGIRVKINVVPLNGYNRDDLPELVGFALENGYSLRFIELMPVGLGVKYQGVDQDEIRAMIKKRFGPLVPLAGSFGNGPAEYFHVNGYEAGIGFISALSKKFCRSCNRIRLKSTGYLKTCLHHDIGVDLKPILRGAGTDDDLTLAIAGAVRQKPLAHDFGSGQGKSADFTMNSLGG